MLVTSKGLSDSGCLISFAVLCLISWL